MPKLTCAKWAQTSWPNKSQFAVEDAKKEMFAGCCDMKMRPNFMSISWIPPSDPGTTIAFATGDFFFRFSLVLCRHGKWVEPFGFYHTSRWCHKPFFTIMSNCLFVFIYDKYLLNSYVRSDSVSTRLPSSRQLMNFSFDTGCK